MHSLLPLLTSPEGMTGRRDYWIGMAVLAVTGMIFGAVPFAGTLVSFALLYPWICLSAKRLRDMGRPVGLIAIPLIPCLLMMVSAAFAGITAANPVLALSTLAIAGTLMAVGAIGGLVGLCFVLWLGLTPSQDSFPSDRIEKVVR